MRIFVTGATGFVGSAVVNALLQAGHRVLGLARGEPQAEALRRQGADVQRGDLADLDRLAEAARASDGVIHTGFNHDFSRFAENCETDARAIQAMGEALAGSARPLLATGGVAWLAPGRIGTERDQPPPPSAAYPRRSEAAVAALAARGVHASVVRLAPSVHGRGDHGFVPHLVRLARETGISAHVGEGRNRWPAVHRLDAAQVFVRALDAGAVDGRFHAVAEEGIVFRDIAAAIGRRLGVPVVGLPPDEARRHFGWFTDFAAMDAPTSSARTRESLGWQPREAGLLHDIEHAGYFDAAAAVAVSA